MKYKPSRRRVVEHGFNHLGVVSVVLRSLPCWLVLCKKFLLSSIAREPHGIKATLEDGETSVQVMAPL